MCISTLTNSNKPIKSGSTDEFKLLMDWSKEELAIKIQQLDKKLKEYQKREKLWNMKKN